MSIWCVGWSGPEQGTRMTTTDVVAELRASNGRRFFAWGVLVALGVLLVSVAVTQPPAPGWQVFLVVLAALSVGMAEKLRRATAVGLVLDGEALRTEDGTLVARLDDIRRVDRGVFAFKPSNGFILVLRDRGERHWSPGLWWRSGKRVGVGGVVSSGPAKFMAEQISLRIDAD